MNTLSESWTSNAGNVRYLNEALWTAATEVLKSTQHATKPTF